MVFSRNLAVMIGSGLPLTRALEALAEQSSNRRFREIVLSIRQAVVNGKSFAEGLQPYGSIFGVLFVSMIESGEISGNLERVLKILSRQMKRDHDLRSKVRGAMLYPAIVVGVLVLVGVLMMIFVVPTLTETFTDLGIQLPLTTRIVIGTSHILLTYYVYLAVAVVAAVVAIYQWLKTERGKDMLSAITLRLPIFGPLVKKLNSARFARTLSSLITSGIPITKSLEVTSSVLGNTKFRAALAGAAVSIQRGDPLSGILKQHRDLFPPMVTEMIQVGEETGTISKMLLRLALFYEEEVTTTTKNLSSIIEPVLMVVVGTIVGFFAVSMIQPIYSGLGNI
jgi:type IV pilus assembly protein PilC